MALKTKIDKAAFDELPEALQEYYTEDGESFVLDVDGVDDHPSVAGLKKKLDEVMGETKAEREKRKALEKAQADAEKASAEEKGEYKKLYEKLLNENEELKKSHETFKTQIQQRDIEQSAMSVAQQLAAKDAKRQQVLKDYAAKFAKMDESGQISWEMAGVKVDQGKVLEHLKTEFPFLVDGSQASGGGAAGDGGRAPEGKQISRSQFDEMGQADRASFFKDGGKVVDD